MHRIVHRPPRLAAGLLGSALAGVAAGCAERVTAPGAVSAALAPARVSIREGPLVLPGPPCPLFIVDGARYAQAERAGACGGSAALSARLGVLRPEDVAAVYVYKGSAALAHYGSAARGGVIVIVTRVAGPGGRAPAT